MVSELIIPHKTERGWVIPMTLEMAREADALKAHRSSFIFIETALRLKSCRPRRKNKSVACRKVLISSEMRSRR